MPSLDTAQHEGEGAIPAAESPLDEAWVELIQTYEAQAKLLATTHTEADFQKAKADFVEIERDRHAALTKVAEQGGDKPPGGVPAKYKQAYEAAEARMWEASGAATKMLGVEASKRMNEQLAEALAAYPELQTNPFMLSSALRTAGSQATVTLVNNKALGEQHRPMTERLKQLAGASQAESVIESDGTYKLVLSPVADFDRFVKSITFGDISNRDDATATFTLTIDPARFSAAAGGGSAQPSARPQPGRPPFGGVARGPRGGSPAQQMEQRKADFIARVGGANRCVTLVLADGPESGTPEYDAFLASVRRIDGVTSTMGLKINGRRQLLVGPVGDFAALVAKLDFATVTAQNAATREITVSVPAGSP